MNQFCQLLKESVITQSLLALIVMTTISIMLVKAIPIPAELWSVAALILGFFFGAKVQQANHAASERDRK